MLIKLETKSVFNYSSSVARTEFNASNIIAYLNYDLVTSHSEKKNRFARTVAVCLCVEIYSF